MDSIMNLFTGELVLSPDLLFVARCLSVVLVVDVLTSLISTIVSLVKTIR